MKDSRDSLLKLFSLGIVVEDKKVGSNQIKVYPVEHLPYIEGLIKDFKPEYEFSLPNIKGTQQQIKLKGDAVIVADWLPPDSNRMTAPDVVANESVELYRYADTDRYYWKTNKREPLLRRLETVCHAYGNLKEPGKPIDKESSYWTEVSTHEKRMALGTSKSDGEKYKYDVIVDAKNNTITVKDDVGNSFILNSQEGSVDVKAVKTIKVFVEKNGFIVEKGKTRVIGDLDVDGNVTCKGQTVSGKVEATGGFSQGGVQLNVP